MSWDYNEWFSRTQKESKRFENPLDRIKFLVDEKDHFISCNRNEEATQIVKRLEGLIDQERFEASFTAEQSSRSHQGAGTGKPTKSSLPKLPAALISFDRDETVDLVHRELKGYFPGKDAELLKALKGERLNELLLFPDNGNRFVEVFRRLKYNGKLLNNYTEIRDWICANFSYRYKRGDIEKVNNFKESTVYDILIGKPGTEPAKKLKLLQNLDWLHYKSKNQLDSESEEERLK